MIEAHGQTDVGRRRKLNEDNFLVDDEVGLYAVCDGMGGHNAGEVASKMAIETMAAFIKKSAGEEKDITWPYGLETDLSFEGNRVKTAIRLANKRVFKAADNREDYTGMGTTAVAVLVAGSVLTVGSAGDSRCYLVRDGRLTQVTRDDSWVSAAWAEGILTAEIERHPLKNVITKAVGAKDTLDIDIVEQELKSGDIVLLCSDGLHAMIRDDKILELLQPMPPSLAEAASRLIAAANDAGGRDNVSAVLLRYTA